MTLADQPEEGLDLLPSMGPGPKAGNDSEPERGRPRSMQTFNGARPEGRE